MSKSVYVVSNMEQENNVLKALIESGYKHPHTKKYKYSFVPSINGSAFDGFPYEIIADKEEHNIYWRTIPKQMVNVSQLNKPDELIIYDGREENDKMKISKEVYDALNGWLQGRDLDTEPISGWDMFQLPQKVDDWIMDVMTTPENNNRLIAIIRWVNGEDVFKVEKPKKWVVRSKDIDSDNNRLYVEIEKHDNLKYDVPTLAKEVPENATKFDTKEEAESWTNSHQEVVEVN